MTHSTGPGNARVPGPVSFSGHTIGYLLALSPQRIHRRLKLRICHAAEAGPILLTMLGKLDDGVKVPKRRIAATLQVAVDRGEPGGHEAGGRAEWCLWPLVPPDAPARNTRDLGGPRRPGRMPHRYGIGKYDKNVSPMRPREKYERFLSIGI